MDVDSLKRAVVEHCRVSENGTKIEIPTSGISFDDFDRFDNVGIWKIAKYFSTVRVYGGHHPEFCIHETHNDFLKNYSAFVVQSDLVVQRSFYRKVRSRRMWFSMILSMELVAFENSSLFIVCEVRDPTDDELLLTMKSRMVVVDKANRRKANHSETFCLKFSRYNQLQNKLANYEVLQLPIEAFHNSVLIRASDTDFNQHTNNTVYIQLCMDCATIASVKHRHFTKFSDDIGRRLVKFMKVFHSKESKWGDVVEVYVWEDASKEESLFFQIHISNSVIFHMYLQFYPEEVTCSKL